MAHSGMQILKNNEKLIRGTVNVVHLLPYLSFDPLRNGVNAERLSLEDVNEAFLKEILSNPSREVFQCFKDALRHAGMTKIYDLLDKKVVKDEKVFGDLVLRHNNVMKCVDWSAVLNHYYEKNQICRLVKSQLTEMHNIYGWTTIITYISTTEDWFFNFIRCLKELKELKAVGELNPLFFISESDDSLRRTVDEMLKNAVEKVSEEAKMSMISCQESEYMCKYVKLFGSAIYDVDIGPILNCLYESKTMSFDEIQTIKKQEISFWKILSLLEYLKKKDAFVDFIIALQECKERKALKDLDIRIDDDKIEIEKKIAHIKYSFKDQKQKIDGKESNDSSLECDAMAMSPLNYNPQCNDNTNLDQLSSQNDYEKNSFLSTTESLNLREDDEDDNEISETEEVNFNDTEETRLSLNKLNIKSLYGRNQNINDILEPFLDCIKDGAHGGKLINKEKDGSYTVEFIADNYAEFTMEALQSSVDINFVEEIKHSAHSHQHTANRREEVYHSKETLDTKFELRSYQKELAEYALSGKNCIIVAPTGSGKTHVAIHIIIEHFKNSKENKVLFIVPTVALVEQQKKQVELYCNSLHTDLKVSALCGSSDLSLDLIIGNYQIFVLTPQILVNQLTTDPKFLKCVTLIILDECHHTNKDHPYNSIMFNYISNRRENRHIDLPQIVGLTASIGVGKSKTMRDAVDHVSLICANLDCPTICTVTRNLKELQAHVNKPDEDTLEVRGRHIDPFHDKINLMMGTIEKRMMESKERYNAEKEIETFQKDINPPSERGNDPYTQWLSRIRKSVCTIHKQDTRMFYITMIDYLMMYNNSLLINADCRTKDAVNYIENRILQENYSSLPLPDGLNEELVNEWKRIGEKLKPIVDDPKYNNPKLEKIKNMICEYYRKNNDSRCIIFCKTRDMASALVNWMNETPDLKGLNPTKLVGTNAPSNKSGMTSVQQDDVLKFFKNGEHKVLIATSVAEEGLDVQKCNIVIRYEHVTNSIARVQTRGRARQENAKYVLVAEKGSGAAEKEEKNAIREEMMRKAILEFQSSGFQERRQVITSLQNDLLVSRQLSECGKQVSQNLKKENLSVEEFEIRCAKCDQFAAVSSNIRKIEESHHVIIDPKVRERIEIRPYPKSQPLSQSFKKTGKIFCDKCKCDWGIMAIYKNVSFPVVKVKSFVVKSGVSQSAYNKWKDVPFSVTKLDKDDLKASGKTFSDLQKNEWNEMDISECDYDSD